MATHAPPPVTYPVGRGRRLCVLLSTLGLIGLWVCVAAALAIRQTEDVGWRVTWLSLSCVAAVGGCWAFWHRQRRAQLIWDGQRWCCRQGTSDSVLERLQIVIDIQFALLLRAERIPVRVGGRVIWIWTEFVQDPELWHLFRCALHFSSRAARSEQEKGS